MNHDGNITRGEETFAMMPGEDEVRAALARGDDEDDDDEDRGAED